MSLINSPGRWQPTRPSEAKTMMLRGWQWVVGGGWWFVFGSVGGAGRWAVVQTKTASGRKKRWSERRRKWSKMSAGSETLAGKPENQRSHQLSYSLHHQPLCHFPTSLLPSRVNSFWPWTPTNLTWGSVSFCSYIYIHIYIYLLFWWNINRKRWRSSRQAGKGKQNRRIPQETDIDIASSDWIEGLMLIKSLE